MFMKGKCQVCGKETEVAELCSVFGNNVRFQYCEDCVEKGAEPYRELVSYISLSECGPNELTNDFTEIVKASVKAAGKTEKQFWKDVKRERKMSQEDLIEDAP